MIGKTVDVRRDAPTRSFLQELREANPAGAELLDRSEAKANIARSLRAMRKARHMTQEEVSAASGLTQPMISRLEAPTGSMPDLNSVMRYVSACGGHLSMDFQLGEAATAEVVAPKYRVATLV